VLLLPFAAAFVIREPAVAERPAFAAKGLRAALVEAVEEAVLNSLTAADTMVGRDGNRREALPLDDLVRILDKYRARGWGRDLPGLPG
jgi:D-aminopeptidase